MTNITQVIPVKYLVYRKNSFIGVHMFKALVLVCVTSVGIFSPAVAQMAKPEMNSKTITEGMPKADKQEISVLTATLMPGDKTPFHTHRFPVTVYILEGAFTLELEGQAPVVVKAGQSYVEPPHVKMTGFNKSATDQTKIVIFYVSEAGMPFLDPVH